MQATHPAMGAARIGPNSIIQTVGALEEQRGPQATQEYLRRIGQGEFAERLPTTMVDEITFIGLIGAIRADMGVEAAGRILARSGERTADYLLANRIPAPARVILPWLPRRLGLSILLKAISGHAWTFAGTGRFSYRVDSRGATISLADSPESRGMTADRPICRYYESCFQSLLRPLIDRRLVVREVACAAHGAEACVFEVR